MSVELLCFVVNFCLAPQANGMTINDQLIIDMIIVLAQVLSPMKVLTYSR